MVNSIGWALRTLLLFIYSVHASNYAEDDRLTQTQMVLRGIDRRLRDGSLDGLMVGSLDRKKDLSSRKTMAKISHPKTRSKGSKSLKLPKHGMMSDGHMYPVIGPPQPSTTTVPSHAPFTTIESSGYPTFAPFSSISQPTIAPTVTVLTSAPSKANATTCGSAESESESSSLRDDLDTCMVSSGGSGTIEDCRTCILFIISQTIGTCEGFAVMFCQRIQICDTRCASDHCDSEYREYSDCLASAAQSSCPVICGVSGA